MFQLSKEIVILLCVSFFQCKALFSWISPKKLIINSNLNLLNFVKHAPVKQFQRDLKFIIYLFFRSWTLRLEKKQQQRLEFHNKTVGKLPTQHHYFLRSTEIRIKFVFPLTLSYSNVTFSWFNFLYTLGRCILI